MPVSTLFRHPPSGSEPDVPAAAGVAPTEVRPTPEPASAATAGTSAAHHAVEAVLAAADRLGAGGQRAVNLQFSFSNADLAVRVELREGAVHATFRTDSAELRSALAHEWQAVSAETSHPALRRAEPVFAAGNGAGSGSSAGDTPRQPRDSGARPAMDFPAATPGRGTASASSRAPAGAAPAESIRRATTRHFQTFA